MRKFNPKCGKYAVKNIISINSNKYIQGLSTKEAGVVFVGKIKNDQRFSVNVVNCKRKVKRKRNSKKNNLKNISTIIRIIINTKYVNYNVLDVKIGFKNKNYSIDDF